MKIAIIGAGYAGLSAAWHLASFPNIDVTLFDALGVGGGASGVSTGLLHPYPAKAAKRSTDADEGMKEAFCLLAVASKALQRPVFLTSGVLRLSMSEEQTRAFQQCGSDAEFWTEEQVKKVLPQARSAPGLWIPQGTTVFSKLYLEGLWKSVASLGTHLVQAAISHLSELDAFDRIIIAGGSGVMELKECQHLPLKTRKGQVLICKKSPQMEQLSMSLVGYGHLSLMEDPELCQLGSTYEEDLNPGKALLLRDQVGSFFPPANNLEVVEIRSGVRIAPKVGYLPLIKQISSKSYVFSGLGSRGLLYHGLYGKMLAQTILS